MQQQQQQYKENTKKNIRDMKQQQQQQLLQCKRLRLDVKSTECNKPLKSNFYFYLQNDFVLDSRPSKGKQHLHHEYNYNNNGRAAVNNNSETSSTTTRHLELSPITYNVSRNPNKNNHNNNNDNKNNNSNNNTKLLNKRWLNNPYINKRASSTTIKDEKRGFLVLNTKADKYKPKNNSKDLEQTLPRLLDRENKRNEVYDGVQQNIEKAIKSQQNKRNELYNKLQTESSKNNKITAKDDVKILEEATVRNSIRKCESWLQKYF